MKIAFLILAHKNEKQLNRLVKALSSDKSDVFIHLDRKCSFGPEAVTEKAVFTEKRFDIGLYEFAMVEAELELIKTAKNYGSYGYFVIMSAQCMPVKKIDEICTFFEERYPEPFIEIVSQKPDNYVRVNYSRVYLNKRFIMKSYGFLKKKFPYKVFRVLRYIPGGIARVNSAVKEIFVKSPQKRLEKMGITGYCGSQWWVLPDKVIEEVCKLGRDKYFCGAISDVYSCDESFFQTAVMATPAKEFVTTDKNGDFKNSLWFYNFVDGSHPRFLTTEDFEAIKASGKLFARKLDTEIDEKIFELIENS